MLLAVAPWMAAAGLVAPSARAQPAAPTVTVSRRCSARSRNTASSLANSPATEVVEIRSRVGGYLTEQCSPRRPDGRQGPAPVHHRPRPYEIALPEGAGPGRDRQAQLDQATRDVSRGNALRTQQDLAASVQDQRVQQMKSAAAALSAARADIRSAQLDLSSAASPRR